MTSLDSFRDSLAGDAPPGGLGPALTALWWAGKPDWDRAHGAAQSVHGDRAADWVHAYLHRVEGDGDNAAYWYGLARRPAATGPVEHEWAAIAAALLP